MPTPIEALAGVPNAAQALPNLTTAGQPSAAHFAAFGSAGGAVVLDIRDPSEPRPFNEAQVVAGLGMTYLNIPVTPPTMTDETMGQILGLLREHAGREVLFHCASANRVGGPMVAHLMLDHGLSADDATEQAIRLGLRSREVLEWGLE
ncbi:MAG: protein tyrosine phosphatase family protein, partial [Gemmatimonadales bacterium]